MNLLFIIQFFSTILGHPLTSSAFIYSLNWYLLRAYYVLVLLEIWQQTNQNFCPFGIYILWKGEGQ